MRASHFGLAAWLLALACASSGCDEAEPTASAQANEPHAPATPTPRTEPERGASPFDSRDACLDSVARGERLAREPGRARVATWNVRWFPFGRSNRRQASDETDLEWLACLVVWLDVDVLALQEIVQNVEGRRAVRDLITRLDALRATRFEAMFDECPDDGRQHVGFLFDTARVRADRLRTIGSINPAGGPCAHQLRPAASGYFTFEGGLDLEIATVHLDSGTTARDHGNRRASAEALVAFAATGARAAGAERRDPDLLVLGDFNTMGCDRCEPAVTGEQDLADLDAVLGRGALPLARVAPTHACSEIASRRASLLDHVYASRAMRELPRGTRARVEGPCSLFDCRASRASRAAYFDALSDHCPLVVDLDARDLD